MIANIEKAINKAHLDEEKFEEYYDEWDYDSEVDWDSEFDTEDWTSDEDL